jgi:transposase
MALTLTTDERAELERRVRSLKIRAEDTRRARVILMLADGESYSTIEATVPCYRDYINRWRRRFLADRVDGLRARYRGQPPTVLTRPRWKRGGWPRRSNRRPMAVRTGVRESWDVC